MPAFNIKRTRIVQAVRQEKLIFFRFSGLAKKLFKILAVLALSVFLYFFLIKGSQGIDSRISFRFFIISFSSFIIFWHLGLFFNFRLKRPKLPASLEIVAANPSRYNLAEFLDFDCAKAVYNAARFSRKHGFSEISSSALFYFLIFGKKELEFIFSRALLDTKSVKKLFEDYFKTLKKGKFTNVYSENFLKAIFDALERAKEKEHERITAGDLLASLAKNDVIFNRLIIDSALKEEDFDYLARWMEYLEGKIENNKRFWDYKNLAKKGSIAKDWASGYTITLDRFSTDWTEFIRTRGFEEIIGHKEAISQAERILAKTEKKNVLLVGEPGSGRGSIIQALAQKSLFGESLPGLNYKRFVELNIQQLLAEMGNPEEVEAVFRRIFDEAISAGNIVLVINEFHEFVGDLLKPGVVDITGVLAPYLKSPQFQILAVTTYSGLHRNIEQNASIISLLEKVEVSEISEKHTIILLENQALALEQKFKKFVTYPAIRDIVVYCKKYITESAFPKKALDLLDELMVYVAQRTKDAMILPEHVAALVSEKTQIPVGELASKEKEKLLNLEDLIHQRIINQEEAVNEISAAMRRTRANVTIRKGPMGAFLFLGPTGVGKTETAKALAEIYFGSEEKMIRMDMSEFQTLDDIARLLGSKKQEGQLTTKVKENPFSLVLLDEIEKAHPNILNLFLQILDEGHITDGEGRKIDFKNTLIIATSNAGYQVILEALKASEPMPAIKGKLIDFLFKEGIFRPEFINRFDSVVVFKSLSKEHLIDIAELMMKKLKNNLKDKGIDLVTGRPLLEEIVRISWSPVFGAREMRRAIQDKIENVLAVSLLSGEIKRGDKVEIDPQSFKAMVKTK